MSGYDRIAAQCTSRNLLIKKIDDDIETIIYEATDSATDYDDVRVSSIQLNIIRCPHTAVGNKGCRKSSVFYTYLAYEGKHYKLMIDRGSCANFIAKTVLEKMSLKAEVHPYPHNVN